MKRNLLNRSALSLAPVWALLLASCTSYDPPPQRPVVYAQASYGGGDVVYIQSVDDFYEPLTPYGEWVVVGSYGRCWRPSRIDREWRPYSSGVWVHSDAGWCWQSDEPWGWATYHYGRWDFDVSFGWIWIPETQWAPAWVEWRTGGGYVGWAPMPPRQRPRRDREREFVFVEDHRFVEPVRPNKVIVNNTTIIQKTVNVTNTTVVNNTVINEGPRVEVIEKASGRKVSNVPVTTFRHTQEAPVVEKHPALAHGQTRRAAPTATTQFTRPAPTAETPRVPSSEQRVRNAEPSAPVTTAPAAPRREERPSEVRKEKPRRLPAKVEQPTNREAPPSSAPAERASPNVETPRAQPQETRPRRVEPAEPTTRAPESIRREERQPEVRKEAVPPPPKPDKGAPQDKKKKHEQKPKKDDDDKGSKPST